MSASDQMSKIQWRAPWRPMAPENAPAAEQELQRELSPQHVLRGRSAKAVGYRIDCDDILFHLGEKPPQFAVVHLTFQAESDPAWPHTVLYDTLEAWVQKCMAPDAEEFGSVDD